jgi:hypothetical protein
MDITLNGDRGVVSQGLANKAIASARESAKNQNVVL